MKQPDFDGRVVSEALYKNVDDVGPKVSSPAKNNNLFGRPSIIPGVKYPISDEQERLLNLAWQHACRLRLTEAKKDPLLEYMRKEVERIRTEELGYE